MVCLHFNVHKCVINIYYICAGIPVAWAIMDKEDVPTLETFFKSVNERVPQTTIKTVMTDDGKAHDTNAVHVTTIHLFLDPALVLAFQSVYSNTKHLLCRWHIER